MNEETALKMECVARVMAAAIAIQARIEGFKAGNAERASNGLAIAYDESQFFAAERELEHLVKSQIGLE